MLGKDHPAIHAGLVASMGVVAALTIAPGIAYGETSHCDPWLQAERENSGLISAEAGDVTGLDGIGNDLLENNLDVSTGAEGEQPDSAINGDTSSELIDGTQESSDSEGASIGSGSAGNNSNGGGVIFL